ncbi:MAG: cellulase family glycosylhydrolase [Phycicoccus sp.]
MVWAALGVVTTMLAALLLAGATASAAEVTIEAESSPEWRFSAGWEDGAGDRYTRGVGETATLSFTGTKISLFGTTAPHHGIATVDVDGTTIEVDQFARERTESTRVFDSPTLPAGTHTLTVTMTDKVNPSRVDDGDPAFSLDKAVVETDGASPSPSPTASATPSPTPTSSQEPGLITQEGTKLFRNGQQYKFAGMNADTWFGCWDGEKEATTDANLDRYFGELNPHSMTRIWAYPNAYDAALMERIVAAAERHGQYLMVTLTDGNDGGEQCGGLPENYGDPSGMVEHVRDVVPDFAGRNTVAVWEVCNECSIDPGETKEWYRAITDEIRAQDADAVIAIGGSTCYTSEIPLEDCIETNDLPNNDMVSIHEYDDNDGGVSHWADETAEIARRLDIPAFVGETGVTNGGGDCGSQGCNAARMAAEWTAYLAEPEYAGMLFWDFKWGHADPTTVNLNTPMWDEASSYRHEFQGS